MNIGPSDPINHADITQGSDLSGMDLTGVDLTSADLSESYLSNVILAGADLSEVCFVNTHLTGADLTDTTLAGADLSNATLTGADLSNADLSGADLSDADLINTDLTDATLRGVDLSNATFAGADLTGADLRGTALTDNEIRGANASEARKDTTTTTTADTAGADASLSDLSQGKSADQKKSDELLTILQSLYDQLDRVPKSTELPENSKYSPNDFYTEFGSWDEALEAAGIDKEQALLDELNRVGEKLGHVPKNSEISAHGKYSYSTYSSYFGSWNEALQQSGFEGRSRTRCESSERSREEMLSTLQSLHERLDRVPKTTDLHNMSGVSQHNYTQTFGSWDKALEAAGIDKEQAILDEIKRVAKKLGHIPTTTDIHKHDAYPASRYSSCFDSWDEALRESGVKERFETKSRESSEESREEMINTLQSLYNQLDRVPKTTELPENSKYSPHDFYTEFGSWDEALKAAGIDKKQAILDEIERVAEELGDIPTTGDIDNYAEYPASNYHSHFDSWDEALEQSGVKERFETESRESSEEMINTLQSLYNQLDRAPKSTELPEKYSPHDFYTEFGSWDEALKAAGIDRKQTLLEDLNQVAEEVGHVPKTSDVNKHGTYSYSVYLSYFDSWDEALQHSGIRERFETKSRESSEEMINTLQSLHNELERVPKSTELPENSKYSSHDFYTGFGSWDEALKAAGIDKKQALLEDLNQVAEEVGHVPKPSDVNKYGTYSYTIHQQSSYFDSWDEALQQSGVKERFETESRESSEEMINTLQSLYNQLDRVPKPTELPEKYSPSDFSREFGSWNKALKAAGIDKKQAILDEIEKLLEIRGIRRPTARRILEAFGTVDEATSAPTHELTEIRGVGQGIAARITSKTGRQTGPDHDQPTTTAKSETSPEKKDNDSIEILDKIANEFEEL